MVLRYAIIIDADAEKTGTFRVRRWLRHDASDALDDIIGHDYGRAPLVFKGRWRAFCAEEPHDDVPRNIVAETFLHRLGFRCRAHDPGSGCCTIRGAAVLLSDANMRGLNNIDLGLTTHILVGMGYVKRFEAGDRDDCDYESEEEYHYAVKKKK